VSRDDIYLLGSHKGTLYIGVTSNLYLRVMQHKEGTLEGFTAAYGCKRLLYFEGYEDIRTAIVWEKQLKAGGAKKSSTSFARSIPSSKNLHRPEDGNDYSA
jgi:putative endonuclease